MLGGVLIVIGNATTLGSFYGTNTYPLTYKVLDVVGGLFSLFVLIVTAIYAGELVWRERDTRIEDITDSMPAPTWLGFLAKLLTLVVLQAVADGRRARVQHRRAAREGLHAHRARRNTSSSSSCCRCGGFFLLAVLALTVHTLVNNKYLGHFVVLVFFLATAQLPDLRLRGPAVSLREPPGAHLLRLERLRSLPAGGVLVPRCTGVAFAVLLLVLTYALWVRGRDGGWRARWRQAAARMTPAAWSIAGAAGALFVGVGAWIYYNTHVLNDYQSRNAMQRLTPTTSASTSRCRTRRSPR